MALTTASNTGSQESTQSPQAAGQAGATGANANKVQPGTATSLLNNTTGLGGVPLHGTALSVVNFTGKQSTSVRVQQAPTHHQLNPALFGISGLLCVLAIALFWFANKSEKSTTKY